MSKWATRDLASPCAFIQWKGTRVCMDFYCPCGASDHFDTDFAYFVRCSVCGKVYEMSAMVEAREAKPEDFAGAIVKEAVD